MAALSIVGAHNGDRLRQPTPNGGPLRLQLSTLGGQGPYWWFINGKPQGNIAGDGSLSAVFERPGSYQISVLDEAGQTAKVELTVSN